MGRQRRWTSATGRTVLVVLPLLYASHGAWALEASITGVSDEVESNIRAYLQNVEAEQYTEARLEGEVRQRTEEAMRVYGYYEPDITFEHTDDELVSLEIEPGPQIEIEILSINVEGDASNDPPFQQAVEDFPLEEGDALRHAPWERLRGQFSGLAIERGYFDWGFTDRRMEVRPYLQSARLYMDFDLSLIHI